MDLKQALKTSHFNNEVHRATINVLYTAWWLKSLNSRALKPLGITIEQFNVLRILKGSAPNPMCVREIASRMIEKSSNVPRIINKLKEKGLIQRCFETDDRRENRITLTQKGHSLLEEATNKVNSVNSADIDLNENQAREINNLLELMRQKEF